MESGEREPRIDVVTEIRLALARFEMTAGAGPIRVLSLVHLLVRVTTRTRTFGVL